MSMRVIAFLGLLLTGLLLATANGAPPIVLSHQGRLLDASDQPVNGTITLIYSIYDAPTGGNPLWSEDHPGVQVSNGLFSEQLGKTVPLSADLFSGSGGGGGGAVLYLQIQVAGEAPMLPRLRLGAAPSAALSTRVSGDIATAPGLVVMGDTTTGNYATFGEKVNAGLHAAGSALATGASRITSDCDDGRASVVIDKPGMRIAQTITPDSVIFDQSSDASGKYFIHAIHRGNARVIQQLLTDDSTVSEQSADFGTSNVIHRDLAARNLLLSTDECVAGQTSSTVSQSCDTGGVGITLLRLDSTPARISTNFTVAKQTSRVSLNYDADGDGVPESGVDEACTPTTSSVAIQTKGTGADKNRVVSVSSGTSPDSAVSVCSLDLDGDGVADNGVSSSADVNGAQLSVRRRPSGIGSSGQDGVSIVALPTTSGVAINTKGTGADKGRVALMKTDSIAASSSVEADLDGDGIPDNFSIQVCTADSVYHEVSVTAPQPGGEVALMKAKEKANRTKCSSSLRYQAPSTSSGKDDDCDGFSASRSLFFDSNGDGVPENGIQEVCLPTSSSVAIKTKGTGADNNRSASLACVADVDGDGTIDRQVYTTADSTTAGIAIDEPGVHVAAEARKGWDGTVKGRIAIDESGVHRVLFDSDGNGFLSGKVGIGVSTPVHAVDVSGGAYCDGTNWVNASDANSKENFVAVDGSDLLNKIAQLAVTRWNYKNNTNVTHIGPTAQDFQATFGVGSDGKSISTIDPSGIALAAIKELNKRNSELEQKNADLSARLERLQQLVEKLAAQNNPKATPGQ
jgi:hypothetical protein